jgi:starch phosphorylase
MTQLITEKIGDDWLNDLNQLQKLEAYAENENFRQAWHEVKLRNKQDLAEYILKDTGIKIDSESIFDVLVKRMHEYKRQLLKVLHIITLHQRIKADPDLEMVPYTFIFGAKAAPGYHMAKLIIKLINSVAEVINNDPEVRDRLKVVFLPNFNVSLAEKIYPSADISEQISMAGKEASGTGNMKFALNGALTTGTLDGANIEIREHVGAKNFFLFGLTAEEVINYKQNGYNPRAYYNENEALRDVLDRIAAGEYSNGDRDLFRPIVESLLGHDEYLLLADYASYIECHDRAAEAYRDTQSWIRMSILNTARCGFFSSDRTMQQYCAEIWQVKPVKTDKG